MIDRHVYFNLCAGGCEPLWEEYDRLEVVRADHDHDLVIIRAVTRRGDVDEITGTYFGDRAGPIARALARRANLPLVDKTQQRGGQKS